MISNFEKNLLCPVTKSELIKDKDFFVSKLNKEIKYPIINSIPIIINEKESLFSIKDIINNYSKEKTFNSKKNIFIRKLLPKIGYNYRSKENYTRIDSLLDSNSKILVIGGATLGSDVDILYKSKKYEILNLDIKFGDYTQIINDVHHLSFSNDTFDCVIIQAVLEHVLEPKIAVDEIYRVLKYRGIVYAETAFMQGVHLKQYDFTRFTHLGHRWLFRNFEEISSGPCCGPGMALAWSFMYFLRSFTKSKFMTRLVNLFSYFTSFYLKYFDKILLKKQGSYDSASAFFFIGRKTNNSLSIKELTKLFRGN